MRVLLTGGAGFIGSHLSDALLARGDEVAVIDDLSTGRASRLDNQIELYRDSILNSSRLALLVRKIRPELIVHLAGQGSVRKSISSPDRDANVNVIGTINALEAARTVAARMLFCSTSALYGSLAPVPSPEAAAPAPESPYGVAKHCAEMYIRYYNHTHGTRHSILRFANVYGPRQDAASESGVVSIFCFQAMANKAITIYGDGRQTRDYVYVSDAVAAMMAASEHDQGGTWNIGTGTEVSVLDLIAAINQATGRSSPLEFTLARDGEIQRSALCPKLAERDLGWRPTVPLAAGVEEVCNWIAAGSPDRSVPLPHRLTQMQLH